MKFKNQILVLLSILVFSSCSSDDENIPIENEPETVIEQTAIINLTSEESNEIDFGDVVTNITSTRVFNIQNSGNSDLNITNIIIPDNYTIDLSSGIIPSNASKEFTIAFIPTDIANYSDSMKIESNATSGTDSMPIKGFGVSSVYDGSVVLKTQEEVDDFGKLGYTSITGGLNIGHVNSIASSIISLESLNKITEVGFLEVFSTTSLENLNGLENLNVINTIQMVSNAALKNIDALISVTKLEGFINFLSNPLLSQIDGLENITEVGQNVRFNNNPLLENINGLSSLVSIATSFELYESPLIENLDGLSNLTSVLEIDVRDNDSLFDYCAIVDLLKNSGSDINFPVSLNNTSYNRYNPTKSDLVNDYAECRREVPEGVYHGSVRIDSSSDIDKFVSKGYHSIDGELKVFGESITSLEFLGNITSINNLLTIANTNITNLDGLENVTYIPSCSIQNNEFLSNYCGLSTAVQNDSFTDSPAHYNCNSNLYNPSLDDLQNGNCAE